MHFPEACLFDLDGVLLDTEKLHSEAWSRSAAQYGAKLSSDQLNSLRGRRRVECAQQIIEWIKKPISIKALLETHEPISKGLMNKVKAMPGAELLVRWCFENDLPMALVTSSTSISVNIKTKSHAWLDLITTRVHGDDPSLKEGKPSPDPFLLATKKLGVDPKKCWVLEDSISGIESAVGAGCHVWFLNNSLLDITKPSKIIDSTFIYEIKQLDKIIEELKSLKKG